MANLNKKDEKVEYIHILCNLIFKTKVKQLAARKNLKVGPYIKMVLTEKIIEMEAEKKDEKKQYKT